MACVTNSATRSLQAHVQEEGEGRGGSASGGALVRVYRGIAAAVVLCSVGGMVALDAAGAYALQISKLSDQAAAACDAQGENTERSIALVFEGLAILTKYGTSQAVQAVFEAIALLLICISYLILVPLSVAMFRRAERCGRHALLAAAARSTVTRRSEAASAIVDDTVRAAAEQRRRLLIACVVVLVTFPARISFVLLKAYSGFSDPYNPECAACSPCQSDRFLIKFWLDKTPEFQPIVVALSSPLPLFMSLWIITDAHVQAFAISLNILRARLGRNLPGHSSAAESRAPLI